MCGVIWRWCVLRSALLLRAWLRGAHAGHAAASGVLFFTFYCLLHISPEFEFEFSRPWALGLVCLKVAHYYDEEQARTRTRGTTQYAVRSTAAAAMAAACDCDSRLRDRKARSHQGTTRHATRIMPARIQRHSILHFYIDELFKRWRSTVAHN